MKTGKVKDSEEMESGDNRKMHEVVMPGGKDLKTKGKIQTKKELYYLKINLNCLLKFKMKRNLLKLSKTSL